MKKTGLAVLGGWAALPMVSGAAWAQDVVPPKVDTVTSFGVSLVDGEFAINMPDLAVGPLTLTRHQIGGQRKPNDPLIGGNMSHSFDIYVAPNRKTANDPYHPVVHIGNSASGVYIQYAASMGTVSENSVDAQRSGILAYVSGNYVYTERDGTVYSFTSAVPAAGVNWASQRVSQISFPDGRVQTFAYVSGNLKLVSDSSGYAIVFDYNGANDVSAACGFDLAATYVTSSSTCTGAAMKVSYGYTSGLLTSVTDVMGQTTTYTNVLKGVTCIKPPGYSSCKVEATSAGGGSHALIDGSVWTVTHIDADVKDPEGIPGSDGDSSGSVTDPNGKTTSFTFTQSSPYSMTDASGNTTQFRYTGAVLFDYVGGPYQAGSLLVEATEPEGNKYQAEYNGPFKAVTKETSVAKPGSGLASLVKEYGYGSCTSGGGTYQNCAKPVWVKDYKGNQTDYAYTSWGGLVSEMQPAPTSGAARPLKLYTYVQKYAYVKNSGGSLVAVSTPIWLLDTETICQTAAGSSAAACDGSAPQLVTTYLYGANGTADNLLLRGKLVSDGTTSLRTCFTYDAWGRKISETSPRAGLSSC